jgi:acylphosphatase
MSDAGKVRLRLIVSGRVQGVFYRASAADQARDLGLTGWVRNRADGSVELVAEGPRPKLEMFWAWANLGPPQARVDKVRTEWSASTGEFREFRVD